MTIEQAKKLKRWDILKHKKIDRFYIYEWCKPWIYYLRDQFWNSVYIETELELSKFEKVDYMSDTAREDFEHFLEWYKSLYNELLWLYNLTKK